MRACAHARARVWVCGCVGVWVWVWVWVYVYVWVCVCVCVCVQVRMCRESYPSRYPHDEFINTFACICTEVQCILYTYIYITNIHI